MNAAGTSPVRLTSDPAHDTDPAWSPDGRRIAFTSTRQGGYAIWVMNADGPAPARLVGDADGQLSHPAWSPDGATIALAWLAAGWDECLCLGAVGADGSSATGLVDHFGAEPAWSPDGRAIASARGGGACPSVGIQVTRADGTDLPIAITSGADSGPAWRR